jgi:cell filamentation protein, protein adenylyltransferase
MDPHDYRAPSAGTIVRSLRGDYTFVPTALPPEIVFDATLVLALSRADAALSELAGVGRLMPNPHLFIAPYLRREAVLSSRIEGTRTNLDQLLVEEAAPGLKNDEDLREVQNYVVALEDGIELLNELPLSLRLVRELHARLMRGLRGEQANPGEFRREQNWIGGRTIDTAIYVPPPPERLDEVLGQWEAFLHDRSLPDLIQIALLHEQFEAIHPFRDGNGRVGRLLIPLFLMERRRLPQPLLYISGYLEANRRQYYDLLQAVRTDGAWVEWIRFFLQGVEASGAAAMHQAHELMQLREELRARVRQKPQALALLDELFRNPYVTISGAARALDTTAPTASNAVRTLEAEGVLREVTGRSWGRLYVADPILRIIDPPQE